MKFEIPTRLNPNLKKYPEEEYTIARNFAKAMYDEFGKFIACAAIFGSVTKMKTKSTDIDVLIIVDDLRIQMTNEVVEAFRVITDKIVSEQSRKLHVTTLRLTAFWEYVRAGDPVAINILRDGVSMIDIGFFDPLQMLLWQGRIRPSPEAIWNYFTRAPATMHNSKWHVLQATLDLYWAVIDSAHSVLMKMGEVPPSPEHVADLLDEKLAKRKLIDRRYVSIMREFYKLSKMIVRREIKDISGFEYDKYYKEAHDFVTVMRKLVEE